MTPPNAYSQPGEPSLSNRLLIVGAGGFGREVLTWANDVPPELRSWRVAGFLDANPAACDGFDLPVKVVGDPADYCVQPDDVFICAIGDPATKLRVARSLQDRGARFINLIHPTAKVGPTCRMGRGNILCPYSLVTCDAVLGDFVTINIYSSVAHDAVIGDGVTLSGHCEITGGVVLEEGVFLGVHAAVAPRLHIPAYVKVGAGSVVYHKPRAGTTVVGVPARKIPELRAQPRAA
jgi:sugar O-acyltransferase (sialic acid O-acetyltransferase NeuD family)